MPQTFTDWPPALVIGLASVALVALLVALYVWRKGRPFHAGDVFRASRLSSGNHLFPTQVAITPTSVIHYTPQWVGRREHSIHTAHISSVQIDTNLLFSDVSIETSGGAQPVVCHGHSKRDAVRMKQLVEQYQSEYFRGHGGAPTGPPPASGAPAAPPPASG